MRLSSVFTLLPCQQKADHPVGTFEMKYTEKGWSDAVYHHELTEYLKPEEVHEFTKLVNDYIKTFQSSIELRNYFQKNGERLRSDGFNETFALQYSGRELDYIAQNTGNTVLFFPYRKTIKGA